MITLKNITLTLNGEPLFKNVSFAITHESRIGLVGQNGVGKSTLLKVVLGDIEPDGGVIKVQGERVGYVPQESLFNDDDTIASFLAPASEHNIRAALAQVGLEKLPSATTMRSLSAGQKTRIAFAKMLVHRPTVLLLDEPTNHLDYEALEWLEQFIQSFKGGVLMVSHDRALLDAVATSIIELDLVNQTSYEYGGNYTHFLEERRKRLEGQERAYSQQQKDKKRLELRLALKKQEAQVYDDPAKGKQVRALKKRLQREVYDNEIKKPQSRDMAKLNLSGDVPTTKLMVRCTDVTKRFGESIALKPVSFEVRGGQHVSISGRNGAGKSTLLKIIVGELQSDGGSVQVGENVRIGYFAQEHETLNPNNTVLEEFERVFMNGEGLHEYEVRKILGRFLFTGSRAFVRVRDLSMGERVRLIFAKLTHGDNHMLILDEPMNHVDILSREAIEEALVRYDGAILVVSHDRYFLRKLGVDATVTLI